MGVSWPWKLPPTKISAFTALENSVFSLIGVCFSYKNCHSTVKFEFHAGGLAKIQGLIPKYFPPQNCHFCPVGPYSLQNCRQPIWLSWMLKNMHKPCYGKEQEARLQWVCLLPCLLPSHPVFSQPVRYLTLSVQCSLVCYCWRSAIPGHFFLNWTHSSWMPWSRLNLSIATLGFPWNCPQTLHRCSTVPSQRSSILK